MSQPRRRNIPIVIAWAALIALMLTSLASAYVPLGPWNLVIGLVIAAIKSLIVLFVFMGLVRGPAVLRLAAAAGFAMLALLFALSSVDYATRSSEPAATQQPQRHAIRSTQRRRHGVRTSSNFLQPGIGQGFSVGREKELRMKESS